MFFFIRVAVVMVSLHSNRNPKTKAPPKYFKTSKTKAAIWAPSVEVFSLWKIVY